MEENTQPKTVLKETLSSDKPAVKNKNQKMPTIIMVFLLGYMMFLLYLVNELTVRKESNKDDLKLIVVKNKTTGECFLLYDAHQSKDTIIINDVIPCD